MVRFRRPEHRSGALRAWQRPSFWSSLFLIALAVWWFGFRPASAQPQWVSMSEGFALCGRGAEHQTGCVVDGDTVIIGYGPARRRIRITGYDAPEIDGACPAESAAAERARLRLHAWLGEGAFEWDGGAQPPRDQYGRELRMVRRIAPDGTVEELAATMIAEGLAAESGWGTVPKDWCD